MRIDASAARFKAVASSRDSRSRSASWQLLPRAAAVSSEQALAVSPSASA